MKRNKNVFLILLLFMIILLLFSNFFIIKTLSNPESSVQFKFEQHSLIDSFDNLSKSKVNLRHNNIITDDYNGTYSFEKEVVGTLGIAIDFIDTDTSTGACNITIESNFVNHNKILKFTDVGTGVSASGTHLLDSSQDYGTVEWWMNNENAANQLYVIYEEVGGSDLWGIKIDNDLFYSLQPANWVIIIGAPVPIDNTWYHIRVDYEATASGYMGLVQYDYYIYINGVQFGKFDFRVNVDTPDKLMFSTESAGASYNAYFDAFGFSWDVNYSIGNNKYPIIEIVDSNILTKDKYEFNLNDNSNPYSQVGYPDVDFWDRVSAFNYYVYPDTPNYNLKPKNINGIKIWADYEDGTATGIKNESLALYIDKFNITFGFQFKTMTELNSYTIFKIYSLNNTEIINLKFNTQTINKVDLQYYDGSSYQDLVSIYGINATNVYNFNLYIYNFNVNLSWYKNDIYNNTYSFPLISELYGINQIHFLAYDITYNTDYYWLRLNYIGIYQYNISLSRELGYIDFDLEKDWTLTTYNIFNFVSNESVKILGRGFIEADENYYIIREFDNKDFTIDLHNIEKTIINAHLFFIANYSFINFTNIFFSMNGIKMAEYIKDIYIQEYYPSFTYGNVDNDTYIYVDDYNRLQYVLSIKQNDTVEYIWVKFDIDDVPASNRSIYFRGRQITYNIGRSFFKIQYTDYTDEDFYLDTYLRSYSSKLKEGKTIKTLSFLITDYDDNDFTNFTSKGYITDVKIRVLTDIKFTILTMYMIGIIISIILIFIPTLAVYYVYKKAQIIIPMISLMSIVCFSTGLIPFELFFLIMICMGCGFFLQYKIKKD